LLIRPLSSGTIASVQEGGGDHGERPEEPDVAYGGRTAGVPSCSARTHHNGKYGQIVAIHGEMSHRMHGADMMGNDDPVGEQRFLSWHGDYVLVLEKELKKIDSSLSVPYWDWTTDRKIPAWLKRFKPSVPMPNGSTINVIRYLSKGGAKLPSKKGRERRAYPLIRLHYLHGWPGVPPQQRSRVGRRRTPDEYLAGRSWDDGQQDDLAGRSDVLAHHAQIDRIWSIWQKTNSGKPTLSGAKAKMDPWPETVSQPIRSMRSAEPSHR
jgi:hypothetical protein